MQRLLVVDDDRGAVLAGVGPHPGFDGGRTVPGMVVGGDDEPGVEQRRDQVQVAARMPAKPVRNLTIARRRGRCVDPAVDLVAAVGGGESISCRMN